MINGRDEIFAVNGAFSKSDASNLESNCANIEIKLNEMYGPKQEKRLLSYGIQLDFAFLEAQLHLLVKSMTL
jgi:hypothetical protein